MEGVCFACLVTGRGKLAVAAGTGACRSAVPHLPPFYTCNTAAVLLPYLLLLLLMVMMVDAAVAACTASFEQAVASADAASHHADFLISTVESSTCSCTYGWLCVIMMVVECGLVLV